MAELLGTQLGCALLLVVLVGATAHLTDGLQAWTYDELRQRRAARGELRAPPMALRDAGGQALELFSGTAADGPVYLVDFIYTRCPTVCQALGSEFHRTQEALRAHGPERVRLLSVSIDPRHDTATALAAHGRLHRADPALWTLAAPRSEEGGRLARQQLGVVAVPDGFGGYVHNGSIHLVDADGRVHGIFGYAEWPQALVQARALAAVAP